MDYYTKQRIALRYWLQGAGFFKALEAMDLAEQYHRGTRKDGVTPEFAHQIGITSYVRSLLPHLAEPEGTLVIALLHDVREDYDLSDAEIRDPFGGFVADGVEFLTKTWRGLRRDDVELFKLMATHPGASIVKPADRINNQGSMVGVFSAEKMVEYMSETRELFLPMLKAAKRRFPAQEPAYENAKFVLTGQLDLLTALTETTSAA